MAWIKIFQTLPTHRKTKRMKRLLKVKTPQAVGHVVMLWLWAVDNAPDGDLSQVAPEDVAEACEWPKAPGALLSALRDAGFVDDDMRLHGWEEYSGRLIEQLEDRKRKDRERQQRHRAKKSAKDASAPVTADGNADVTRDKDGCHADVTRDKSVSHASVTPLDKTRLEKTRQDRPDVVRPGGTAGAKPKSVAEVEAYAQSVGSQADARKWWDYFQDQGWTINGDPITDWTAVFRKTHSWRRFQPGSGLPAMAKPEDYQPSAERIRQNADWLDIFLAEQNARDSAGASQNSAEVVPGGQGKEQT